MHLGKLFPSVARPRVTNFTSPYWSWPPRKLAIYCTSYGAPGAKAAPWYHQRVLSSVVEMVSPSSDHFKYEWICPTDSNNVIRADIEFLAEPQPFFPFYWWRWPNTFTHYISGVAWGSAQALTLTNQLFAQGGYAGALTLPGPTPPQPTQWTTADFQFEVAYWAEQPDYHPYRH